MIMLDTVIIWIASAALAHGLAYAYFQRAYAIIARRWVWRTFWTTVIPAVVFGPFALISIVIFLAIGSFGKRKRFYGLKFLPRLDADWRDQVRREWADEGYCGERLDRVVQWTIEYPDD